MSKPKPKVGIFGLTGCAGDQLQILNCEEELLSLAERLDIVDWVMVRSHNDHTCRLDIAFVEGVVATERDLATLKEIRARATILVALGTCAVWGGLPAMQNEVPREVLQREVYHNGLNFLDSIEALPATHFVPFEYTLPGCPIERPEFLKVVNALLLGTRAGLALAPVCWECKTSDKPVPRYLLQGGVLRHDDARRVQRSLPVAWGRVRRLPGSRRGAQLRRQHHHVRRPWHLLGGDRPQDEPLLCAGVDDAGSREGGAPC